LRRLNGSAAYWTRLSGALLAEPDIASTPYYRDTNLWPGAARSDSPSVVLVYGKFWNLRFKHCTEA
jgi:hypothetical protein